MSIPFLSFPRDVHSVSDGSFAAASALAVHLIKLQNHVEVVSDSVAVSVVLPDPAVCPLIQ
eukprot:1694555-Ditylum_brightwellii.AAC.1